MYRFHFFGRTGSGIGGAYIIEDLFAGAFVCEAFCPITVCHLKASGQTVKVSVGNNLWATHCLAWVNFAKSVNSRLKPVKSFIAHKLEHEHLN